MGKKLDTFEKWVQDKKWPEVRDLISNLFEKGFTKKYISERLGINEATFYRLYDDHAEIREIFYSVLEKEMPECKSELKRQAFGYWIEEEVKEISSKNDKKGTKGGRHKRWVPGNFRALVYYMTLRYGPDYMENAEALKAMERMKKEAREDWNGGN